MITHLSRRTLATAVVTGALAAGSTVAAPAAVASPAPAPASPAPASTSPVGVAAAAAKLSPMEKAMFSQLNAQRAQHGLAPLTSNVLLARAARAHNLRMSAAQTLSHQLPGEASFDQRITAQGYVWRAVAENVGYTTNTTTTGPTAIQKAFYNEVAPNDGHRRNILSTATTQVGISVYVDTRGKLWVTQDFGAPR